MLIVFPWQQCLQQCLRERASMPRLRTIMIRSWKKMFRHQILQVTLLRHVSIPHEVKAKNIKWRQHNLPPCTLVDKTCSTRRQGRRSDYKRPGRPEVPLVQWLQPPAVRRLPTRFGQAGPSTDIQHYFTNAMFYTAKTGTFRWLRHNLPEIT